MLTEILVYLGHRGGLKILEVKLVDIFAVFCVGATFCQAKIASTEFCSVPFFCEIVLAIFWACSLFVGCYVAKTVLAIFCR